MVVWEHADVLKVPVGALFRRGNDWALFTVLGNRAVARTVRIGHQNAVDAEVLDGATAGDQVIVHPSERVSDGTRIDIR